MSDEAGLLSLDQRDGLDALGDAVHRQDGAELAVVTVASLSGRPVTPFARELFRIWALGHPQRQNGVLLFVSLADRNATIILGAGIDTPANAARALRIMQEEIVPQFRAGAPDAAILSGAHALAHAFFPAASAAEMFTTTPLARPANAERATAAAIGSLLDRSITTAAQSPVVAAALPLTASVANGAAPATMPQTGTEAEDVENATRPTRLAAPTPPEATPSAFPHVVAAPTWLLGAIALGLGVLVWRLRRRRRRAAHAIQRLARFARPGAGLATPHLARA